MQVTSEMLAGVPAAVYRCWMCGRHHRPAHLWWSFKKLKYVCLTCRREFLRKKHPTLLEVLTERWLRSGRKFKPFYVMQVAVPSRLGRCKKCKQFVSIESLYFRNRWYECDLCIPAVDADEPTLHDILIEIEREEEERGYEQPEFTVSGGPTASLDSLGLVGRSL